MMIAENADLHRDQRVFRSVLDAFARPGTVHAIEPAAENPARPAGLDRMVEQATRLFVDQAVRFCVVDAESDAMSAYFASETNAHRSTLVMANFVVVPARADAEAEREAVAGAFGGTLMSPERGATVIVGCSCISEAPGDGLSEVKATGPGVRDVNRFYVDRAAWARARAERGDEFPCGIEILLVDVEGNAVAVPRSTCIRVAGAAEEEV